MVVGRRVTSPFNQNRGSLYDPFFRGFRTQPFIGQAGFPIATESGKIVTQFLFTY
jgi:hypothetical protein